MKHSSMMAVGAGIFLASSLLVGAFADDAANKAKPGIGKGPAVQQSLPSSSAPPPTPTQHTGATNQSGTVKAMNKEAQKKVEAEGK